MIFEKENYSPLIGEFDLKMSKLLAIVPCSIIEKKIKNPHLVFSVLLEQPSSGKQISLPIHVLDGHRKGNSLIIRVEMTLKNIEPGDYTLHIMAEETNTGFQSETSTFLSLTDQQDNAHLKEESF